jgi:hypothetical protein
MYSNDEKTDMILIYGECNIVVYLTSSCVNWDFFGTSGLV